MTLTHEDLKQLQRHFAPQDHEFLNENAYITEDAITARIEEIDPAWELTGLGITYRQTFGNDVQVTVTVRLTIRGVSREGVGSSKVIGKTGIWEGKYPNKVFKPLPPEDHSEVNEAEKSAATDALKRAARLFGIGRYLLTLPKSVVNEATLKTYFNSLRTQTTEPPKQPATTPKQAEPTPTGANTPETQKTAFTPPSDEKWWTDRDEIARVRDETGITAGLLLSKIGAQFSDFPNADGLINKWRAEFATQ